MKLKVLTFNVHKFRHPFFRKYLLNDLKEILKTYNFDIVCLQELVGHHPKNHVNNYNNGPLEHLADEIWTYYAYGKNAVYPKGHHGNAILSFYPIKEFVNYNVSNHKLEQRGILHSQIWVENQHPLDIITLHFDLTEWGRKKQVEKLVEITTPFLESNKPIIITGDFNDWRKSSHKKMVNFSFKEVASATGKLPLLTFPSFKPLLALDRIYFSGLECTHTEVLNTSDWRKMSDHLPIYAEFEFKVK